MLKYEGPIAYEGRSIIVVLVNGERQAFYRSTGKSSGMPGIWLPFDGITIAWGLWFAKDRYARKYTKLHRFGTQQLKDISDELGKQDIPEGNIVTEEEINNFINNKFSKDFNKILCQKLLPLQIN